ncbi:hypothetical protein [Halomonas sp.]|uniref:hypothetical protein n=1 Tax=Halomonas sp. TaxID=1486246 RepID=UPI00384ADF5A
MQTTQNNELSHQANPTHFNHINHEKIYIMPSFLSTYEKLSLLSHATGTLLFYQDIAQQVLYHALPLGLG